MQSNKQRGLLGLGLTVLLSIVVRVRADDETALQKAQALIEKKAAAVRSVSASLTLQGMTTERDGNNPVDCHYQKRGVFIAKRSPVASKTSGARKSKKSKGSSKTHANEGDQETPGATSPDVILWSLSWKPLEYSKECPSTANRGVMEAAVYDGENLYSLLRAMIEGTSLTQLAFRHKAGPSSLANLVSFLNESQTDLGVMRDMTPLEVLLPCPGAIDSWKQRYQVELRPEQKLGKESVIVLDRTIKSSLAVPSERYYFSKISGVLLKYENRDPAGKPILTLTTSDVKINKPVRKGAFEFKPPPGVVVQDFNQTGRLPSGPSGNE